MRTMISFLVAGCRFLRDRNVAGHERLGLVHGERFAAVEDIQQAEFVLRLFAVADHEARRQRDAGDVLDAEARGEFEVDDRERDGQPFAVVEDFVDVAVRAAFVVVAAAVKAVLLEEILRVSRLHRRERAFRDFRRRPSVRPPSAQSPSLVALDVEIGIVVARNRAARSGAGRLFHRAGKAVARVRGRRRRGADRFPRSRSDAAFCSSAFRLRRACAGSAPGSSSSVSIARVAGLFPGEKSFHGLPHAFGHRRIERFFHEVVADAEALEARCGAAEFAQRPHDRRAVRHPPDRRPAGHSRSTGCAIRIDVDAQGIPLAGPVGVARGVGENFPGKHVGCRRNA